MPNPNIMNNKGCSEITFLLETDLIIRVKPTWAMDNILKNRNPFIEYKD
ncbi:hypothetical protein V7158_16510 [Priestia megaterium]